MIHNTFLAVNKGNFYDDKMYSKVFAFCPQNFDKFALFCVVPWGSVWGWLLAERPLDRGVEVEPVSRLELLTC